MMKRKKQWNKGRTIVAYGSTCVGKLLKLAALAIQELLNSTWPSHFGNWLAPTNWKDIHRFFETTALDDNLVFLNHDLVGFFNSIPQSTILSALQSLIQDFLSLGRSDTLMVDLHSKVGPVHAGKSRFSVKANQIEFNMVQLMDIIQFSFLPGALPRWANVTVKYKALLWVIRSVPLCLHFLLWHLREPGYIHMLQRCLDFDLRSWSFAMWTTVPFSSMKNSYNVLNFGTW